MIPLVMAGISALLQAKGAADANSASVAASDHQMDFQREMRASAHQTEVQDLRAAGLNPILSAGGSGASMAPGAQPANIKNVAEGAVASAQMAEQLKLQQEKQEQEIKLLKSQTGKVDTENTLLKKDVPAAELKYDFMNTFKNLFKGSDTMNSGKDVIKKGIEFRQNEQKQIDLNNR